MHFAGHQILYIKRILYIYVKCIKQTIQKHYCPQVQRFLSKSHFFCLLLGLCVSVIVNVSDVILTVLLLREQNVVFSEYCYKHE